MQIKWKRLLPFLVVALWLSATFYGWSHLQKRWSVEPYQRQQAADNSPWRTRGLEPWNTGQDQARTYKASVSSLAHEIEKALLNNQRGELRNVAKVTPEGPADFSLIYFDVLFQRLLRYPEKALPAQGYEALLRRWPQQKEEIELAMAWIELRNHRMERSLQRLSALHELREHPYVFLIEAHIRAAYAQEEASTALFHRGIEIFQQQSIDRLRAGIPLDIWVSNYEVLLFGLAESYLVHSWWDAASLVLTHLTQQQADQGRLTLLLESLRNRLPLGRAG